VSLISAFLFAELVVIEYYLGQEIRQIKGIWKCWVLQKVGKMK